MNKTIRNFMKIFLFLILISNTSFAALKLVPIKEREGNFFIEVRDNGEGMEEEVLEKAFIPFYTGSQDGTGMGLPICQRIAEAHAGSIELRSEKGKGTVAKLCFPSGIQAEEGKEHKKEQERIEHDKNIS